MKPKIIPRRFKEIERIVLPKKLNYWLRIGAMHAVEHAGFLYGLEKNKAVYLVKLTPFLEISKKPEERSSLELNFNGQDYESFVRNHNRALRRARESS